jgi:drug/metabolite transporter (DMT)-like permease
MRVLAATLFVLLAFAANSVLCRLALQDTAIDAVTFMVIRLLSGALTLWLLLRLARRQQPLGGDWRSAGALLAYALLFTFAYLSVSTGTGALLLFGAVQLVMISSGLISGERFNRWTAGGWLVAVSGLVLLLLPGLSAPPLLPALMMLGAGVFWGIYSLRGRHSRDPLRDTAGNFARAVPGVLLVVALTFWHLRVDRAGALLALSSGAVASGLGYAAWYAVLPRLTAIVAANLQLSVPVIAATGGVVFTRESISLRLAVSSLLVLGGIAVVTGAARKTRAPA